VPGGEPCGFVIEFEKRVQALPGWRHLRVRDMAIIRELYAPDLCMLPIGDLSLWPERSSVRLHFAQAQGRDPDALRDVSGLTGTPEAFQKELKARGCHDRDGHDETGETIS